MLNYKVPFVLTNIINTISAVPAPSANENAVIFEINENEEVDIVEYINDPRNPGAGNSGLTIQLNLIFWNLSL
jgi:hypothetical protein